MKIQLLRHATMIIEYGGKKMLIDPMLAKAGTANPIPTMKSGKNKRNPLVELPMHGDDIHALLRTIDTLLVTHMHNDHFDSRAEMIIPKHIPVLCQPVDETRMKEAGFEKALPVEDHIQMQDISIIRTDGRHGGPLVRHRMGPVSGFILRHASEPSLYICGDTVWCPEVKDALSLYRPEIIVLYAGAAQLPFGRSITMNEGDIAHVMRYVPDVRIVAVHMEAVNHCLLSRNDLANWASARGFSDRLYIPGDGELLRF